MSDDYDETVYDGLQDANPDAMVADGLHEAYIGYTSPCPGRDPVAVYDAAKCLRIFMDQGMSRQAALEHFEFNVVGSWVGEGTPMFVWTN